MGEPRSRIKDCQNPCRNGELAGLAGRIRSELKSRTIVRPYVLRCQIDEELCEPCAQNVNAIRHEEFCTSYAAMLKVLHVVLGSPLLSSRMLLPNLPCCV
jgi:hypothetical protein